MEVKADVEQMLREHEFMAGMPAEFIAHLAQFSKLKVCQPDQYLFRTGEPADCFFLVRDGLLAIEVHHPARGPIFVQTLDAGKVVGWSWLVPPYKWSFDVRALAFTRGICIGGEQLRAACDADPALGYQVLKRFAQVFADRLNAARVQLLDLYGPKK
ncbi:MAG: cyclic nucleotide-binding domain-containing protein [Candidatus Hydrogenedentes bacterium]|nr:cyclic nucleotide-binding domain-containing protein [Candidatus Hydrogenedentota bacterium]